MKEADPRERLASLAALVGDWSTEASHSALRDTTVRGWARFEWLAGNRFLI
jgi:hypothetical protein